MCLTLIMIWFSITMAKFLLPFFEDSCYNPGGDHGLAVSQQIEGLVGVPGLVAVLALTAIAFLTYLSMETIIIIRKLFNPLRYLRKIPMEIHIGRGDSEDEKAGLLNTLEDPEVFDDPQEQIVEFTDINTPEAEEEQAEAIVTPTNDHLDAKDNSDVEDIDMEIEEVSEEEAAKGDNLVGDYGDISTPYDPKRDLENYHYPTLDLLKKYEDDGKPYIDMVEQTANKNRIVDVLRNFGVEISSIKATVGPTITLYEITPAPGVRISRIRNLEDDIALSLSALGIRIIAPIPGKGTIGIEVPNAKPSTVSMESILNSKKFQESTMELPCAVGKTITNEVFMFDLAKAPHLLVAGATGQGKSVGLNAIITSLLYKKHPAELKIVLVDPKKVEFSVYSSIEKHFLAKVPDDGEEPIITDVTKVIRTLNSLCKEMDTRYDLLKVAQARNIKEYNKKFIDRQLNPEHGHRYMPYIVVVIDEFGDLIMTAGKEVELPIARIAQLARAVGIHMIIATQRPTTNIITGTIKANFPSRIAFRVGAMIDSRTILDRPGAQQLIGRGDMLYLNGGEPVRVQCAFVDTPEVERINQFIAQQQGYISAFELPEPDTDDGEGGESRDVDMQHLDPMFEDAARLIVREQSGSTSLIQRKFAIGYNRAGRLMDQLEKAGIVGAAHGSKPREVLIMDENSLENLLTQWRG
jgi:S-DNA-T family DNA segregation ATPase FtsK/SpoIIIE